MVDCERKWYFKIYEAQKSIAGEFFEWLLEGITVPNAGIAAKPLKIGMEVNVLGYHAS